MSSFGSGFASGMGQGMAMGKMLLDTYNEYDQKDKLKKAGELSPEEIAAGLTPDQQTTADFVSDPNNGYQVEKLDNGGLRYRTADSENSWQELAPGAKKYKLGDKIQDTAFTQDQIDRARADAQSRVLLDAGDVKGAYGLRAMAREDRSGRQLEDVKDWKINMLQNIAQGNYAPVLKELMPYYNSPAAGSRFDDNHHATVVGDKVVFSDKEGTPVAQHPINGKTLSEALNMAFEDKMAALDPKFGLDVRKTRADETKAQAEIEYKGKGGVAERVGMANVRARENTAGGGGKTNYKMTNVNVTNDQGVTSKVPVTYTVTTKGGVPQVQAFTLDGKPVTDSKVINQLAGGEDGTTSARNQELADTREAYRKGNMDYDTMNATIAKINKRHDATDALNQTRDEFKAVEKSEGRDAAVRSVIAKVEESIKNPADKKVVYGQLGLTDAEVMRAKKGRKGNGGLDEAVNYAPQSTWQPGQRRIPENMRGQ